MTKPTTVGGLLSGLLQRNALVVLGLTAGVTVHAALLRREIASDTWYSLLSGRVISNSGSPTTTPWQ